MEERSHLRKFMPAFLIWDLPASCARPDSRGRLSPRDSGDGYYFHRTSNANDQGASRTR